MYAPHLRGRFNASTTRARVATFSALATASSRSRITLSAPQSKTFSTFRAWLPGAKRKLRYAGMELWRFRSVALDLLGQRPFMNFSRSVVDATGPVVSEDLLDDRVCGDSRAAHHLNTAIGHAIQRFRHSHLG